MNEGFVYFGHAIRWDQRVFKVGFSKHPKWRLKELSTRESPVVEIVIVPGSIWTELALHEMLSTYRVHNEWYRAGRRLHRIITYAKAWGEMPECIVEAGVKLSEQRRAKAEFRNALARAGAFFGDGSNFGITHESDPFAIGKKHNRSDLSWLGKAA